MFAFYHWDIERKFVPADTLGGFNPRNDDLSVMHDFRFSLVGN